MFLYRHCSRKIVEDKVYDGVKGKYDYFSGKSCRILNYKRTKQYLD